MSDVLENPRVLRAILYALIRRHGGEQRRLTLDFSEALSPEDFDVGELCYELVGDTLELWITAANDH